MIGGDLHPYGVDGTDIPVGAVVSYSCGVDGGSITCEVQKVRGVKRLVPIGTDPERHGLSGQMGKIEVLSV